MSPTDSSAGMGWARDGQAIVMESPLSDMTWASLFLAFAMAPPPSLPPGQVPCLSRAGIKKREGRGIVWIRLSETALYKTKLHKDLCIALLPQRRSDWG